MRFAKGWMKGSKRRTAAGVSLAVAAMLPAMLGACTAEAQQGKFQPLDGFAMRSDGLVIRRHVEAEKPFTVAGERGVVLGQQDGGFEAWVLPVKLLSSFRIRAEVEGYTVPIDLNRDAAEIEVRPDRTTITYSHIAFTLRQTMFAPDGAEDGTGAVVLFQVDSTRPVDLTFSFTPEMRPMWPERGFGTASPEWVKQGTGGFYVLHTDFPEMAGAVAMPGTQPGVMAPYQERPQVHALELKLHYDPKDDATKRYGGRVFPLLMAVGTQASEATNAALEAKLERLEQRLPELYAAHAEAYAKREQTLTAIQTPDEALNRDFGWAETSIEQLKARTTTGSTPAGTPGGEVGLVAGYYASGDSARPGFGWFFGRDTLYTLYAVNGFGDFELSREALEFLMARQRNDGKMMHEYSQTAAEVDWKAFPYEYAAADATPLFLTAMLDYVRTSGDVGFLKAHREVVEKAWKFETTHDSDGDGIYDNSQGTGWVESWPGGMPHQEIYLALLDRQASEAVGELEGMLGDSALSASARQRAAEIAKKIEAEYYMPEKQAYAFSRGTDGKLDEAATIYPAIAWWNGGSGLAHPDDSLGRWASHVFSTDWGLRDVADTDKVYDPISYHQGSVWPLFTGWESLAEYRAGRPLAGYAHLMRNADLTTAQDLGAVTELLSGAYFVPFGRSTSHQLWSSAMVITPLLRGLFGLEVDAQAGVVRATPHLPASWNEASVERLHVGQQVCTIRYRREAGRMTVRLEQPAGGRLRLESGVAGAKISAGGVDLSLPLPAVEVELRQQLPLPGSRTMQAKVLSEKLAAHSMTLELESWGGSEVQMKVRRNAAGVKLTAEGAELKTAQAKETGATDERLMVTFDPGDGYQKKQVVLRW